MVEVFRCSTTKETTFSVSSAKITMLLLISDGVWLSLSEWSRFFVILILLLSFIWSFIFLSFTLFVNSVRFCSIRSWLIIIEVVGVLVELRGWSVKFLNLWWSSSISNNLPTTSMFLLLHAFFSCSLFLVSLFSLTVKFLITYLSGC